LDHDGSVVTDGTSCLFAPPISGVNVKGTVGAGDSMVAGFATGMAAGIAMEGCFRRAVAAAAASVAEEGTANIDRRRFEEFLESVEIREV
jgi:1-phosphofructokinase